MHKRHINTITSNNINHDVEQSSRDLIINAMVSSGLSAKHLSEDFNAAAFWLFGEGIHAV
jgi:hypothetical protein